MSSPDLAAHQFDYHLHKHRICHVFNDTSHGQQGQENGTKLLIATVVISQLPVMHNLNCCMLNALRQELQNRVEVDQSVGNGAEKQRVLSVRPSADKTWKVVCSRTEHCWCTLEPDNKLKNTHIGPCAASKHGTCLCPLCTLPVTPNGIKRLKRQCKEFQKTLMA